MISCLEIKKLFNRFDYTIELQRNTITILTGPNGFGKSTILKIISALSSTNVMFFYKLDFQEIIITFDDNTTFSIEKKKNRWRNFCLTCGQTGTAISFVRIQCNTSTMDSQSFSK